MNGHPLLDIAGKTAVVIGGTSGIGLEMARGLAVAGAKVVPSGRHAELVQSACDEITNAGGTVFGVTCDVTNRESVQALFDAACAKFGGVDILINCAGRIQRKPTLDVSETEWNQVMETNLNGTLRACQIFGRHMVARGKGRIINIASLTSFVALHEVAAYAASKSAVMSLTRSLAIEWSRYGVCVNAIAPGVFKTELNTALLEGTPRGQELLLRTPMQRFGKLEELVGAAIFLASDAASFISGQTLVVDGGFLASGVNQ